MCQQQDAPFSIAYLASAFGWVKVNASHWPSVALHFVRVWADAGFGTMARGLPGRRVKKILHSQKKDGTRAQ